ncbi:RNA polymerase sigma factor [Reichenbachiella sp. MALMAid0571]|uniref:RNA polymerase sigma factor n=1 Tax=Reichenbachiella sp. MALMAid0571 TaxID=3143939 RepID=UPI0032DEF4F5
MNSATLLDIAMNHSEKIIRDAQAGDKRAFNKLVSLWYKRIYNFSYKYFNDHDLATEAAQRTFISLFKSLPNLQEIEKFKPWLYKIVLNFCRDEERKANTRSKLVIANNDKQDYVIMNIPDTENSEPDTLYMQNQISELVLNSIEKLNEEQKEVLIMKEYEGLKFREIAEIIGISENTVKSRLYYGFSNLKKIIEKERVYKESVNYGI